MKNVYILLFLLAVPLACKNDGEKEYLETGPAVSDTETSMPNGLVGVSCESAADCGEGLVCFLETCIVFSDPPCTGQSCGALVCVQNLHDLCPECQYSSGCLEEFICDREEVNCVIEQRDGGNIFDAGVPEATDEQTSDRPSTSSRPN
jgi:hypothetical protein